MERPPLSKRLLASTLLSIFTASTAGALELITKEDIVQGVVTEAQLVRVVDNVIILFDTSTSMNDPFRDTGQSKLQIALEEFKQRTQYFPEIGHKFAVFKYTPWEEIYPLQTFSRETLSVSLEALPEKGRGVTPLANAIVKVRETIEPLSGRTALMLFYDGDYTGRNPDPAIWRLVKENDVCFIMVSSASESENEQLAKNIAELTPCSRLISFDDFVDRPEYTSGALFDVRATERIVTTTDSRIVGLDVDDLVFEFDKAALSNADRAELNALGSFMAEHPDTYAVIAGYTDSIGRQDYNEHLSQLRTEHVAEYLTAQYGIDRSRLVLQWYGSRNPVASNNTQEGRAQNRRVEIAVGGM